MAALLAILKALLRATGRELRSFLSVRLNNLFLMAALLAYTAIVSEMPPFAAMPFFLLIGILILFPLSADPLAQVPASRMALWPISDRQRMALRMASLALSPVLWIALAVLLFLRHYQEALLFILVALAAQGLAAAGSRVANWKPALHPLRHLPRIPGRLGGLIRHNLRQMLSVLDFYAALLLAASAFAYRWFDRHADPQGFAPLAMLVALALSTYAQCSFGLDSDSGLTRYRLLPLRAWEILLAKDAAFFIVLLVLAVPLSPGPALTFGLIAVAAGRYPSVRLQLPQQRWRFTGGDVRFGAVQVIAGATMGFAQARTAPWLLAVAFAAYLISLWAGAWYWERDNKE